MVLFMPEGHRGLRCSRKNSPTTLAFLLVVITSEYCFLFFECNAVAIICVTINIIVQYSIVLDCGCEL